MRMAHWWRRVTCICRPVVASKSSRTLSKRRAREHVVRTRIFVTDIDQWEQVAKAHREAFADITPACSMVEVSRLIGAGMLVEIEADAILAEH